MIVVFVLLVCATGHACCGCCTHHHVLLSAPRACAAMVFDRTRIATHYLRGSFALDLFSSVPLDLMLMHLLSDSASAFRAVRIARSSPYFSSLHASHLPATQAQAHRCASVAARCTKRARPRSHSRLSLVCQCVQVKIIRLIRLTKLLRIFRVSKFLAAIESSVSINYSYLQLGQHIAIIALATHWTACSCLLFTRVEVRAARSAALCR